MTADAGNLLAAHARRLWDDDPDEFTLLLGGLVRRLILDRPDHQLARLIVRELAGTPEVLGDFTAEVAEAPALLPDELAGLVDRANVEAWNGQGRAEAARLGRLVAGRLLAGGEVPRMTECRSERGR